MGTMARTAQEYAQQAQQHWATYLPSQYSMIPETDRESFFLAIGQDVVEAVELATEENLSTTRRQGDSPETLARKEAMATARAEEEVLHELVFLPSEPGTENRQVPISLPQGVTGPQR
jgi:hypothetical protein